MKSHSILLFLVAAVSCFAQNTPTIQTQTAPGIVITEAPKLTSTLNMPPVRPNVPTSDQDVLLLFAGQSVNDKILLTLNNNRPDKLKADLTAYDLKGNPFVLPSLDLKAGESRLLNFTEVLRSLHVSAPLGFLKVHYSGLSMELGAQLTLYPVEDRGGLDSPRSLSVDFLSAERHAVAWTPPGSSATFSLTKVAAKPIDAAITVNGRPESLHLEPNETAIRTRDTTERLPSPLVDLDVSFNGPNDALRVFGYVASRHDGNLPIRIYDPKTATTSVLSAVGLVTEDETHTTIRNLTNRLVTVTPFLIPVGGNHHNSIDGPSLLIPARTSVEVPLQQVLTLLTIKGVARATLFLKNDAPPGGLVGALDQRVASDLLQDIPFKTANPNRYMRGAYPLRWEGDYTNAPMIANTSAKEAKVRAYVIAGGVTYTFPDSVIHPGETVLFDVDGVRTRQTSESLGKKIPLTALSGKFHWTPLLSKEPQSGLHGRTELKSLKALRASSFSCGMDCPYQTWRYPYFFGDLPWGFYPTPTMTDAREVPMQDYFVDTYGNPSNNAINAGMFSYGIDDTSVLAATSINNDYTLRMDTGSVGSTRFSYSFTENDTYVSSTDDGSPNACTVQTVVSNGGGDIGVGELPLVSSACQQNSSNGNPYLTLFASWGFFGGCLVNGSYPATFSPDAASCDTSFSQHTIVKQCITTNRNSGGLYQNVSG